MPKRYYSDLHMLLQQKDIVFIGDSNGAALTAATSFTNGRARPALVRRIAGYRTLARCLPGDAYISNLSFADAASHLKNNDAKSSLLIWLAGSSSFI